MKKYFALALTTLKIVSAQSFADTQYEVFPSVPEILELLKLMQVDSKEEGNFCTETFWQSAHLAQFAMRKCHLSKESLSCAPNNFSTDLYVGAFSSMQLDPSQKNTRYMCGEKESMASISYTNADRIKIGIAAGRHISLSILPKDKDTERYCCSTYNSCTFYMDLVSLDKGFFITEQATGLVGQHVSGFLSESKHIMDTLTLGASMSWYLLPSRLTGVYFLPFARFEILVSENISTASTNEHQPLIEMTTPIGATLVASYGQSLPVFATMEMCYTPTVLRQNPKSDCFVAYCENPYYLASATSPSKHYFSVLNHLQIRPFPYCFISLDYNIDLSLTTLYNSLRLNTSLRF
ncbi:hypothetical protein [Chlamydia ibidis]|nr:hypothetical protein [Chlamydia ibidis]